MRIPPGSASRPLPLPHSYRPVRSTPGSRPTSLTSGEPRTLGTPSNPSRAPTAPIPTPLGRKRERFKGLNNLLCPQKAGGMKGRPRGPRPERLFVAHPKAEGGEWGRAAQPPGPRAPGPGHPEAPARAGRRGRGHWRLGAGNHGDGRCQGREPIGASPGRFKNLKQKQQKKSNGGGGGETVRGWSGPGARRAAQSRGGGGPAGQPYKTYIHLG